MRSAKWLITILALTVALTGCATGATLEREGQTIETQLNAAREGGAYRCAPKELAIAESQLEFLETELDQGNPVRAAQHKDRAQEALARVLDKTKKCKPVSSDRDGDGVLDENDQCPDDPGPKELLGCPDRDGDTVLDKDDPCPEIPGPVENRGCPFGDADGDGILDKDDKCKNDPEDKDNHEDEDGCPDPDNDADGILDVNDKCINEPETANGFQDEDGCPDTKLELVEVNRDLGKIEIKQKVFFDTGKAKIKEVSFRLLNEVASALTSAPTMKVMVEGHTDSVGSDAMNLRLSQDRAESVRTYLIGQGVEPERLTAMGFGETKPIDTNNTKAGRERNRRVEFTILGE